LDKPIGDAELDKFSLKGKCIGHMEYGIAKTSRFYSVFYGYNRFKSIKNHLEAVLIQGMQKTHIEMGHLFRIAQASDGFADIDLNSAERENGYGFSLLQLTAFSEGKPFERDLPIFEFSPSSGITNGDGMVQALGSGIHQIAQFDFIRRSGNEHIGDATQVGQIK